ncbi:MAG: BatD family protein [Bacteroidales bacterium]|nr:BatD family protein [Bacteroidales bacterium]
MKRWFVIILLLMGKCTVAQDVSIKASAPGVVEQGQRFRLTYTVNTQADQFLPPTIDDFAVLAGPSTSTSSNVSIINGKVTQSFELKYTYILEPVNEGTFEIEPASVMVDGKKYISDPVTIEVVKGAAPTSPDNNAQSSFNDQQEAQTTQLKKSDLFIRIIVNKQNVYREEHVVATIKLYSRLNVTRLENAKLPTFEGFITQELETPPLTSLNRERIDDQVYLTGVLKKYILFPQTTGKLTIDPFELDVYYQKPSEKRARSIFDDFFGAYENARQKVVSNAVTLNVQPLPGNEPSNFSGAVGNFDLSAELDKSQVNSNEAVTLQVKISGNGNLKYINPMDIQFPADFDVYDPKIIQNIKHSGNGAYGNKTFEYLMIPRLAGDYTIPRFSFSYFDPDEKKYKQKEAGPFAMQVGKSINDTSVGMASAFNKENVKFLGKDIRFINTSDKRLSKINYFILGTPWFYLGYVGALAVFFAILFFRRKKIKENADIKRLRNKKASKYARKRLKNAARLMKQKQDEAFYDELAKALWGYISDKLSIPVANLSKDSAREELQEKKVDPDSVNRLLDIIDRCEYARYAPVTEDTKMDTLYNDAIRVISKLQQKLK